MADRWPVALGAGFLALLISLLGCFHAHRPWGDGQLRPGTALPPWGRGPWNRVWALCFAIGSLGSIAAGFRWAITGKPLAYLISLESPWMIGLVIETYICLRVFQHFRLERVAWEYLVPILLIAVGTVTLQLCGLHVAAVQKPAAIGNPIFHASMVVVFAFGFWQCDILRHRKFVFFGCSFAIATLVDIGLSVWYYGSSATSAYCVIHSMLELLVLSILLCIRVWARTAVGSQADVENSQNSCNLTIPRAVGLISIDTPRSSDTNHPCRASERGDILHIMLIVDITKTEDGVSAQALAEFRATEEQNVLRLICMEWETIEEWGKRVKELIGELAYKTTARLARSKGSAGLVIYVECELSEVIRSHTDRMVLLNGGGIPCKHPERTEG